MVTGRTGHSLPELLVAVVFLGVALVSVGGAAWLGASWTDAAVTHQTAVRLAVSALDSVAAAPALEPGADTRGGLTVDWAAAGGDLVRVSVRTAASDTPIVELSGRRPPRLPTLPDAP